MSDEPSMHDGPQSDLGKLAMGALEWLDADVKAAGGVMHTAVLVAAVDGAFMPNATVQSWAEAEEQQAADEQVLGVLISAVQTFAQRAGVPVRIVELPAGDN